MQWLIRERVDAARRLLESTNATVDSVARQVGLGTSTNLRMHLLRTVGMSPQAYRVAHRN
jgi:transcriptional regulator GlxA family with amidase domain